MDDLQAIAARSRGRFKTAAATVTDGLREAIVRGVLAANAPLRQEELALAFGVSRMPVREALRQLEAEGFLMSVPHRGAVVAELSPDEAREIDRIRAALEVLALRLSLPNLLDHEIDAAAAVLEHMDVPGGATAWTALNEEFHTKLYVRAGSPRLLGLIASQYASLARYTDLHLRVIDYQAQAQEHRSLVCLCRNRDLGAAEQLLAAHIRQSGEEFATFFEKLRSDVQTSSD